jgi:hypothetical protein
MAIQPMNKLLLVFLTLALAALACDLVPASKASATQEDFDRLNPSRMRLATPAPKVGRLRPPPPQSLGGLPCP